MPFKLVASELPPTLDLDSITPQEFQTWRRLWTVYARRSKLADESDRTQADILAACFSLSTADKLTGLDLHVDDLPPVKEVLDKIQSFVTGQVNFIVEYHRLLSRKQQSGESVIDYLHALKEIAPNCGFVNKEAQNHALLGCLTIGLRDGDAVQQLLNTKDLTLATAVELCRSLEAAKHGRATLKSPSDTVHPSGDVNAVQRRSKAHHRKSRRKSRSSSRDSSSTADSSTTEPGPGTRARAKKCRGCGRTGHKRSDCPAQDKTCNKCGKKGHFASVCQSTDAKATPKIGRLYATTRSKDRAPTLRVKVATVSAFGLNLTVLPDTGSEICAGGPDTLKALGEVVGNLLPPAVAPTSVNGTRLKPLGRLLVRFSLAGREAETPLHIFSDVKGTLISWKVCRDLGIVPESYPQPPFTSSTPGPSQRSSPPRPERLPVRPGPSVSRMATTTPAHAPRVARIVTHAASIDDLLYTGQPQVTRVAGHATAQLGTVGSHMAHQEPATVHTGFTADDAHFNEAKALKQAAASSDQQAHAPPVIGVGTSVALQNADTKAWTTYGIVVFVGPHRRYHVRLPSGRVLVRNRRFLRVRRYSSIRVDTASNDTDHTSPEPPTQPQGQQQLRRSGRARQPPTLIVDDASWP